MIFLASNSNIGFATYDKVQRVMHIVLTMNNDNEDQPPLTTKEPFKCHHVILIRHAMEFISGIFHF